jgi:hypothetical protein
VDGKWKKRSDRKTTKLYEPTLSWYELYPHCALLPTGDVGAGTNRLVARTKCFFSAAKGNYYYPFLYNVAKFGN